MKVARKWNRAFPFTGTPAWKTWPLAIFGREQDRFWPDGSLNAHKLPQSIAWDQLEFL